MRPIFCGVLAFAFVPQDSASMARIDEESDGPSVSVERAPKLEIETPDEPVPAVLAQVSSEGEVAMGAGFHAYEDKESGDVVTGAAGNDSGLSVTDSKATVLPEKESADSLPSSGGSTPETAGEVAPLTPSGDATTEVKDTTLSDAKTTPEASVTKTPEASVTPEADSTGALQPTSAVGGVESPTKKDDANVQDNTSATTVPTVGEKPDVPDVQEASKTVPSGDGKGETVSQDQDQSAGSSDTLDVQPLLTPPKDEEVAKGLQVLASLPTDSSSSDPAQKLNEAKADSAEPLGTAETAVPQASRLGWALGPSASTVSSSDSKVPSSVGADLSGEQTVKEPQKDGATPAGSTPETSSTPTA